MSNLKAYLHQAQALYADYIAVADQSTRLTYRETWERGLRLANGLLALGLKPGDRIGTLEDNAIESVDLVLGCAIAAISRVPLYARNARASHLHMLRQTKCTVLFIDSSYADLMLGVRDDVPAIRHVFVRDDTYEDWLAAQPATDPDPVIQPNDEFMVRHSGGTTGRPKGLLITHSVWLNCIRNVIAGYVPLLPGDVAYHFAPITHASGTLFFMAYLRGATNFMARSFNVGAMVEKLQAGEITNVFLPPTALRTLVQHPDIRSIDPAPIKGFLIGGSVTPPDLALTAYEIFGGRLYQLYGASEGGPVTSIGPEEWFAKIEGSNPIASAGRPLPWVEVQIRDVETDAVLPIGEIGEIVCRCEARAAGFLDVEDEARIFLKDGWARTSDIGRLDRNGYLYVIDRKDDMIISGGYNIWPAEIETVLSGHPEVIEAGAFAVPHAHWGQTPHAVCVVAEGAAVTEQELIQLCSQELGSYKKPARVVLMIESLPKTAVGKIDRRALKNRWTPSENV